MDNSKNNRIEEILNSLDNVHKAEAPDFFYTRLKAKMLARQTGGEKGILPARPKPWLLRPAFAFAVLLVVLLVNAFVIINNNSSPDTFNISNDVESLQSIAAEYSVTDAGSLYDLNQDK